MLPSAPSLHPAAPRALPPRGSPALEAPIGEVLGGTEGPKALTSFVLPCERHWGKKRGRKIKERSISVYHTSPREQTSPFSAPPRAPASPPAPTGTAHTYRALRAPSTALPPSAPTARGPATLQSSFLGVLSPLFGGCAEMCLGQLGAWEQLQAL